MKTKIPYDHPEACPNCGSVHIAPISGAPDTARACAHCDHEWDLERADVPPGCVLVRMPDGSVGFMNGMEIPKMGYKSRRQAEMFAWAEYGMYGGRSSSSGRWETAAKRARDAWLAKHEESRAGTHAQMALYNIVKTAGISLANDNLYACGEYVGKVDRRTAEVLEKVFEAIHEIESK